MRSPSNAISDVAVAVVELEAHRQVDAVGLIGQRDHRRVEHRHRRRHAVAAAEGHERRIALGQPGAIGVDRLTRRRRRRQRGTRPR